ncbi:hypothetical protein [Nonomuraea dietziae]|uniref:hypothetical protein n=1 Tax=Nonomuraea dietziae TaxID=65515 RepID=UPI00341E3C05
MITPSPPPNGDEFLAPTPTETFTLPSTSGVVIEWVPWPIYLGCVAAGVIIGVLATLVILRMKRRRKSVG